MTNKKPKNSAKHKSYIFYLVIGLCILGITMIFIYLVIHHNAQMPTIQFAVDARNYQLGNIAEQKSLNYFSDEQCVDIEINNIRLADYNSYTYYNSILNKQSEKQMYRVFEYALYNSYNTIILNNIDIIASDASAEFQNLINTLCCDTPLLEQNINIDYNTVDNGIVIINILGAPSSSDSMPFTKVRMNEKLKTIPIAQRWIDELPPDMNISDKALELFVKLSENVIYTDDAVYDKSDPNYIYDAFTKGYTHCDGYTNALSLLYRLAEIDCYEKKSSNHTWLCFSIDGEWYNADPSEYSKSIQSDNYDIINDYEKKIILNQHWGYSDALQCSKYIFPAPTICNEPHPSNYTILSYNSLNEASFVTDVASIYNGEPIIVIFNEYSDPDSTNNILKQYANEISTTLNHNMSIMPTYKNELAVLIGIYPRE